MRPKISLQYLAAGGSLAARRTRKADRELRVCAPMGYAEDHPLKKCYSLISRRCFQSLAGSRAATRIDSAGPRKY